jgi:tRNA 2-thiouridine synthesizing protein E
MREGNATQYNPRRMSATPPDSIEFGTGRTYTLDRHGFLEPPEQWDEEFAEGMARESGIYEGLTAEHWDFIHYLRRRFIEDRTVPVVIQACSENNLRLSVLNSLFPTGYHRGACRIAGINYAFMAGSNIWLTFEMRRSIREEFELDAAGFLEDFDTWSERFAHLVIHEWNLPGGLTDRHREIVSYLRERYREDGRIPTLMQTHRDMDLELDELARLFPAGYRRGACRLSGLPFAT